MKMYERDKIENKGRGIKMITSQGTFVNLSSSRE
jgi:hypothetical protein